MAGHHPWQPQDFDWANNSSSNIFMPSPLLEEKWAGQDPEEQKDFHWTTATLASIFTIVNLSYLKAPDLHC